jgi:hypothetical protein
MVMYLFSITRTVKAARFESPMEGKQIKLRSGRDLGDRQLVAGSESAQADALCVIIEQACSCRQRLLNEGDRKWFK